MNMSGNFLPSVRVYVCMYICHIFFWCGAGPRLRSVLGYRLQLFRKETASSNKSLELAAPPRGATQIELPDYLVFCKPVVDLLSVHDLPQLLYRSYESLSIVGKELLWTDSSRHETLQAMQELLQGLVRQQVKVLQLKGLQEYSCFSLLTWLLMIFDRACIINTHDLEWRRSYCSFLWKIFRWWVGERQRWESFATMTLSHNTLCQFSKPWNPVSLSYFRHR